MKPDPIKIQALQDLPMPQNQKQLQSFLELVNYLQPFLPDIAAKTTFLREKVSQLDWTPSTAFQQLKQWICNTLLKTILLSAVDKMCNFSSVLYKFALSLS